jgi:hypothetical protein
MNDFRSEVSQSLSFLDNIPPFGSFALALR